MPMDNTNVMESVGVYWPEFRFQKGDTMIRKLGIFSLTIAALMPAVNTVCQAEPAAPSTRHVRDVVLNGQAKSVGRLPATQSMRLVLVLPQRNQAAQDSLLKDLYDPASPSYRQFLTVEEFTDRFGPSQEDYDAVVRFAQTHGFTVAGTARNRLNVDVEGTGASIEAAFHVTMGVYQHPTENRTFYSPDREPTADLAVGLWHIAGLCGVLRRNGSHRQRTVARIAGVLRYRFDRSDHVLHECAPNQQRSRNAALHGWDQHQLRLPQL